MREELRVGLDYLDAVTTLLQRVRRAHPTYGLYQAAEIQWWWTVARSTDGIGQLFWFDEFDRPAAAVTVTDFGGGSSLVYEEPILVVTVLPDASPGWIAHVVDRGLDHVRRQGIADVGLEVDRADEVMRRLMFERGFQIRGDAVVECWLDAEARPAVSPLDQSYRLASREELTGRAHHLARPERPDFEQRLHQTSLYRPDLDLVVLDLNEQPAAYGLFWHDPVTSTGVVEPMRTLDKHQKRGLARHVLTVGIDRLAGAGARHISIGYEPDNPASGHLYRNVGFVPHTQTDLFAGPTGAPAT